MKGIYFILSILIYLASIHVWAGDHNSAMNKHMKKAQWVCETNASTSSNPADQKADDMMKKAMSGKDAFAFAMKHCRDCNKITCSMQTTEQNVNQNQTNQSNVPQ